MMCVVKSFMNRPEIEAALIARNHQMIDTFYPVNKGIDNKVDALIQEAQYGKSALDPVEIPEAKWVPSILMLIPANMKSIQFQEWDAVYAKKGDGVLTTTSGEWYVLPPDRNDLKGFVAAFVEQNRLIDITTRQDSSKFAVFQRGR